MKADLNSNRVVLSKGASEIMLDRCDKILDDQGQVTALTETIKADILSQILHFAEKSLRTIILAYREISDDEPLEENILEQQLTMICLVGIQDPLRPAVK